jgi:hypothetical protein
MFTSELVLEVAVVQDNWTVMQNLIWKDDKFGTLVCPRGFYTDLASIPRILRNIPMLDPDGLSRRPAVMHDWLYAWRGISKDNADEFLKEALLSEDATSETAEIFYMAVHEFGQAAWDLDGTISLSTLFVIPGSYDTWVKTTSNLK